MLSRCCIGLTIAALVFCRAAAGEDQPERPRIVLASPLAVSPGETVAVQLRGFKLDVATRVRVEGIAELTELTIKKQEKSGPPPQVDAKEAGDTLVEFDIKLPDNFAGQHVALIVESPEGATEPYEIRIVATDKLTTEIEPNERLAKAQNVELGSIIRGAIGQQRDVDAFHVIGKAGQKLAAEVIAARRGSVLDGTLSLYDERGRLVATADDGPEGRDPLLHVLLPKDGDYVLVLSDANDRGGTTHPYLLNLRTE